MFLALVSMNEHNINKSLRSQGIRMLLQYISLDGSASSCLLNTLLHHWYYDNITPQFHDYKVKDTTVKT